MRIRTPWLALVVACAWTMSSVLPVSADEGGAKAYVILVGISKFKDERIKPRPNAEKDVKALYDLFKTKDVLGVDDVKIKLFLNGEDKDRKSQAATHANILDAVKWAVTKARKQDLVIFTYVGQGAPINDRSCCYFTTDSTFKDRADNALSAAELETELKKLKSEKLCVFLDINFKGFEQEQGETIPDINVRNLYREFLGKEDDAPVSGRAVFLATSGVTTSIDVEDQGLFTKLILEGLKGAADKEGKDTDGIVTVDELLDYLDSEFPKAARKYGKTKEDQRQRNHTLTAQQTHFVIAHNPTLVAKINEQVKKFLDIAKEQKFSKELAEEGENLLKRVPKNEAHRKLRKRYQELVAGDLTGDKFQKERTELLLKMKYDREEAEKFAAKVISCTHRLKDEYVKETNQVDLVCQAIRGIYRQIDEQLPHELKDKLDKLKENKDAGERELTRLLTDVREKLGRRDDLDNHKDVDIALRRMLNHLDPYTDYINPDTVAQFERDMKLNFTGIGVQITKDLEKDALRVTTPIKGSPAYREGVQAGDVITEIIRVVDADGKPLQQPDVISTKGLDISDAVKKIVGKPRTPVKIKVDRDGKEMEFTMMRGTVEVESVMGVNRNDEDDTWNFVLDKDSRICYIRLSSFANKTTHDLRAAIKKLAKQDGGIKGLILDLRFNPGGVLGAALDISDLFIDDGLIVSIKSRDGKQESYHGDSEGSYLGFPMAVLINGGSASASEIVSACLQDHNRAVVIGERSFGKGSVQTVKDFDGGQIKMTTASFHRPSGKNLNKIETSGREDEDWGVIPTKGYVVKMTPKERDDLAEYQHKCEMIPRKDKPREKHECKDSQLEKAVEYLQAQIKTAAGVPSKKAG